MGCWALRRGTPPGDVKDLARQGEDHEARLRALERARWPLPSPAALVSIIALVVSVVGYNAPT